MSGCLARRGHNGHCVSVASLRLFLAGVLAITVAGCAPGEQAVAISYVSQVGAAEYEARVGCYNKVRVEVDERSDEVELRGYGEDEIKGDCATTAVVTLDEPLGTRRLLDGKTGRTLTVCRDEVCAPADGP